MNKPKKISIEGLGGNFTFYNSDKMNKWLSETFHELVELNKNNLGSIVVGEKLKELRDMFLE